MKLSAFKIDQLNKIKFKGHYIEKMLRILILHHMINPFINFDGFLLFAFINIIGS
jgi:hypothetical protein